VNWINAGTRLTDDNLGNFQQGAKPAAAFSNNLRPLKVTVPNQHLSYPPVGQILSARSGVASTLWFGENYVHSQTAFAGLTHDQSRNTAVATYIRKHTKRYIRQWPTMS